MKATKKDSLTLSDDPEIILPLLSFFFFFLLANTQKAYIRKGHLEADPKAYREYTRGTKRRGNTKPALN